MCARSKESLCEGYDSHFLSKNYLKSFFEFYALNGFSALWGFFVVICRNLAAKELFIKGFESFEAEFIFFVARIVEII